MMVSDFLEKLLLMCIGTIAVVLALIFVSAGVLTILDMWSVRPWPY